MNECDDEEKEEDRGNLWRDDQKVWHIQIQRDSNKETLTEMLKIRQAVDARIQLLTKLVSQDLYAKIGDMAAATMNPMGALK
jgi:hypothetical protein